MRPCFNCRRCHTLSTRTANDEQALVTVRLILALSVRYADLSLKTKRHQAGARSGEGRPFSWRTLRDVRCSLSKCCGI